MKTTRWGASSKLLLLLAVIAVGTAASEAAISLGSTYSEDFNTLANDNGMSHTWTDDSTLPGWSAEATTYTATGGGSSTHPALYSFGSGAPDTDRALGTEGGPLHFGADLVNDTGSAITSVQISYVGEVWRTSPNANTLSFEYGVNNGGVTDADGTWVSDSNLDFAYAGVVGGGAPADGNLPANQTSISDTISGVNIAPGEHFWIRWGAPDVGQAPGLGVDDLSLTSSAVPEPSAYAGLAAGFLGFIVVVRRFFAKRKAA